MKGCILMIIAFLAVAWMPLGLSVGAKASDHLLQVRGPIIIHRPSQHPGGAGVGLRIDARSGELMLRSDATNQSFVLFPAPGRSPRTNGVSDLAEVKGRVYIGYGDSTNNRGPVDIVSYDWRTGVIQREMLAIPEEEVNGWWVSADGMQFVAGFDAMESWSFGSLYVNDGFGWQKRRTIYRGAHVTGIVDFGERLYVAYTPDYSRPVNYPFILVSDNLGVTWSHEKLAEDVVTDAFVNGIAPVSHSIGHFLYAAALLEHPGEDRVWKLYRTNGSTWELVGSSEDVENIILCVFGDKLLISWENEVTSLDGQNVTRVPMPQGSHSWKFCRGDDGLLYCLADQGDGHASFHLYRTEDIETWEHMGCVSLPIGVEVGDICFAGGRLYVGNRFRYAMGDMDLVELWFHVDNPPIANAILRWDADVPEGAQVKIQVCTSSPHNSFKFDGPFFGPDGTSDTFYTESGQTLNSLHDGDVAIVIHIHRIPNERGEWPLVKWVNLENGGKTYNFALGEGQGLYAAANSADSAEYTSPTFVLDSPISSGSFFFDGATPGQTEIRFVVRSAGSQELLASKPFVGPDGTTATYYQNTGQPLWKGHDGDTHVQYRATFTSENPVLSPTLRTVQLVIQDALDHFEIRLDEDRWKAGNFHSVKVMARAADDRLIPITGAVHLSASDGAPIESDGLAMEAGTGITTIALKRAVPTQLRVTLAGITSLSRAVTVLPGDAASIQVTTNLDEPKPNYSPIVESGKEFGLTMSVQDRYRNIVTDYTGTAECWRWSFEADELLYTYTFKPSDRGVHTFATRITTPGEWNIVCIDKEDRSIAGSQTIRVVK